MGSADARLRLHHRRDPRPGRHALLHGPGRAERRLHGADDRDRGAPDRRDGLRGRRGLHGRRPRARLGPPRRLLRHRRARGDEHDHRAGGGPRRPHAAAGHQRRGADLVGGPGRLPGRLRRGPRRHRRAAPRDRDVRVRLLRGRPAASPAPGRGPRPEPARAGAPVGAGQRPGRRDRGRVGAGAGRPGVAAPPRRARPARRRRPLRRRRRRAHRRAAGRAGGAGRGLRAAAAGPGRAVRPAGREHPRGQGRDPRGPPTGARRLRLRRLALGDRGAAVGRGRGAGGDRLRALAARHPPVEPAHAALARAGPHRGRTR